MIHRFAGFSLDTDTCELTGAGRVVPLEPQVFALLRYLIENRERLVTRDEIVARIWNGRIVSDAAIASRLKSARAAIGDDGVGQRLIRTTPKVGLRFVGEVASDPFPATGPAGRPSIAVLPFEAVGGDPRAGAIAEALPHDLIAELSRLRWLFVIARGSSFRFRSDAEDGAIRAALAVRYRLSGRAEVDGPRFLLNVQLSDLQDGGVIWSERFGASLTDIHEIRERVSAAVVSALELEIPLNEAREARLKSPESLNAWQAYHLGVSHMYRFTREGADQAQALFARAVSLDPAFGRAYAGLSFAHFERAFLRFAGDAEQAADEARRFAEKSLELDPLDPFCNLVMGRAHWLTGELEASLPWLERATVLNPNYAQGKYSRAWTQALMGQAADSRANVEAALSLSPLDPLAYGMIGVRAISHMVLDEPAEAAEWAERAARTPGAHALIDLLAAIGRGLNGEDERAREWVRLARRRSPDLSAETFFSAFPFREPATRRRLIKTLARIGA